MSSNDLKNEFEKSASNIKSSNIQLGNDVMLSLYGYYKQATEGDCNLECPGFWDLKGKAKWEAWNEHKGMSKDKAMKYYIKKVSKILEK